MDRLGREARALHLEHLLLEHKVPPPGLDDVGLQGAAGRPVVEEARDLFRPCSTLPLDARRGVAVE
jgi:hypothetical protein